MSSVDNTPCPGCGAKSLTIVNRLIAKPVGTYSLAGVGTKFSMIDWPHLVCTNCKISAPAKSS